MRLLLCNCSASLPPPPSSLSPPKPPPILLFTTTTTTTTTNNNSLNWPHKTLIGALTGALSFSLLFSSPSSVALDSSLLTQSQTPPSSADYCRQEDQTEDRYETAPGLLTNEGIVDEAWEIVNDSFVDTGRHRWSPDTWLRKKEDILATSIQTRSKAHDIIRRMLASLGDPYTRFLSPSEFSKMARYDMTGIGINLREVPDENGAVKLKVLGLILDGPAHTAGVRQGDEVLAVNGVDIRGKSAFEVSSMLQGPNETFVAVKVKHGNCGPVQSIEVQRQLVARTPVLYRLEQIDNGDTSVGYVRLKEFNALARKDLFIAMKRLEDSGASSFILDLRDNLGGLVQAGIEIAKLFLNQGETVFAYGILALEQFLDRLVDLPLLCNHILQISHLHGTHVELIAFVEHTLARISSSHLISNGGSSSFTDPHSGSIPTTVEMVELVGPRSSQHGKQLSSSLPVQQIHQGLLGDRHKAHSTSGIFSKPILPPGNSSNVSLSDIPNPQKNATGVPAAAVLSSSSGFLHSSRAITSSMQHSSTTGFGSALNIETLVAAAERRDTSIEVQVHGKVAYVSQTAWIQTGTIQENILFGSNMDKHRYQEVLEKCSLIKDLELLPFGDCTIIGERGVNLSGGQKQRVQLARALYQDADVYLLDDPFSAVDAHTATSLFNEYVMGALAGKTVLLVTHQVDFLPTFDSILLMSEGKIVEAATYNQLLACSQQFQNLVNAHKDMVGSEKHIKYGSPKSKTLTEEIQEGINTEEQLREPLGDQLIKKEEREIGDTGSKTLHTIFESEQGLLVPIPYPSYYRHNWAVFKEPVVSC